MKKPKCPFNWIWPFTMHECDNGWVIKGWHGLIIIERLTELEASVLIYALNLAYPVLKAKKRKGQ